MAGGALHRADWGWNEMLDAFRTLGGVAQNIMPRTGQPGRGLFPINPEEPVLICLPENLLFRVEDVEFDDGNLRIRDAAEVPEEERDFFQRYQKGFSWGAGGSVESSGLIKGLDTLPSDVASLLIDEFNFGALLEGDFVERSQNRFLRSREILWNDELWIAPLVEFANHRSTGFPCQQEDDQLKVEGNASEEILVSYGDLDAIAAFRKFGLASSEPGAFSLEMQVRLEDLEIIIRRDTHEAIQHGTDWVPLATSDSGKMELSYLMIGHSRFPRLSRGIFRTLLGEAGMKNPDEAFDRILQINSTKVIKLLKALEPHKSEMVARLRSMARFQLEAMSHCVGSRELDPVSLPGAQKWSPSAR